MAHIQARQNSKGNVRFRVQVRLKGHPKQSRTFTRRTDAKRWAIKTESSIREGRDFGTSQAKRHTVAELIDRYVKNVLPAKKSAKDQARQLRWWRDEIGHYILCDVSPALIAECRDSLASGKTVRGTVRSTSTVNRYLAALSHVFTIGTREWAWIDSNPLRKVSKLREARGRLRWLSDDERTKLLDACKARSDVLYSIAVVALSTGARRGEILNLTWSDIDLQAGVIILETTKSGQPRAIPLQGHALELLRKMSEVRRVDSDLVFPSKRDPTKPLNIQNIWKSAVRAAEIRDLRFHDLRHSAASYLAMNGATLPELAAVLGHRTLQTVQRYANLSQPHTMKVVKNMNLKIFG